MPITPVHEGSAEEGRGALLHSHLWQKQRILLKISLVSWVNKNKLISGAKRLPTMLLVFHKGKQQTGEHGSWLPRRREAMR